MLLKIATGLAVLGLLLSIFLSILQEILFISGTVTPSTIYVIRVMSMISTLSAFLPLIFFVVAVFLRLNADETRNA